MSAATTFRRESVTSLDTAALLYRSRKVQSKRQGVSESSRMVAKRATKQHLANLLLCAGGYDEAANVRRCCRRYGYLTCGRHVRDRVPDYRCRFILCPDCAAERQGRAFRRLSPVLRDFQRRYPHDVPVMITLTVASSCDYLSTVHKQFKLWFRKLRRSVHWKRRIRAGVCGFEVTYTAAHGWHYHVHVLAFRKAWYPQEELSKHWQRITGSMVVDIREVKGRDVAAGLSEVLKYCYKPADVAHFGAQQVREWLDMKGARFGETIGDLVHWKLEDEADAGDPDRLTVGSPCPECGDPLRFEVSSREDMEAIMAGQLHSVRNKHGTIH